MEAEAGTMAMAMEGGAGGDEEGPTSTQRSLQVRASEVVG